MAAADRGHRVLLISTDPAHSLGDVLGRPLAATPRRVPGAPRAASSPRHGRLTAVELDADAALARWLRGRRRALATIAERGTYLDEDDVQRLMALSLPGVDELVGLVELDRLARATPCDEVVVDTAPTGHTLRLLEMPATLGRLATVLDDMHAKHRFLAESLGGVYHPDASDAVITELDAYARDLRALLRDPTRVTFTWLLLPEALSLAEARDGLAALAADGIRVAEIVVNRVTGGAQPCAWTAERRRAEAAVLRETRAVFAAWPIRLVPAVDDEPVGVPALRRFARYLTGASWSPPPPPRGRARARPDVRTPARWLDDVAPRSCRLVAVVGKGGVGKTTCAAAIALALARRTEGGVLLLSIDPAHSIADVLATPVGDTPVPVPGAPANLRAREMDATAALAERRERYRAGVETLFRAGRGDSRFEPTFDRAVIENLIELAPPGIDELFALLSIIEALLPARGAVADETVVLDTAPTGHALRLLALPDAALEWVRALLAILLKYRAVTGLGRLASDLVDLSKSLRALRALLADATRARVVVVTRAAAVPAAETARLVAELRRLHLSIGAIVVNGVAPAGGAPAAAGGRDAARRPGRRPDAFRRFAAPAVATPPRGAAALERWAPTWYSLPR